MFFYLLVLSSNSLVINYIPSSKDPPLPSSSYPLFYIDSIDSVILITSTNSFFNTVAYFSVKSLIWTQHTISSPVLPPITQFSAFGLFNSSLFIIGGLTSTGPTNEIWVLSLGSLSWDRIKYFGYFPRLYASGFILNGLTNPNYLIILGGYTGVEVNQQVFQFDFSLSQFSVINFEGDAKGLVSPSLSLYKDTIAAVGGYFIIQGKATYSTSIIFLNFTSKVCSAKGIQGQFSGRIAAGFIDSDSIILLQGVNEQTPIKKISKISLETYSSTEYPSNYSSHSYSHTQANTSFIIFGGKTPEYSNALLKYQTLSGYKTLSSYYAGPAGRFFPVIGTADYQIFIYGGFDGTGFLDDMWVYDISSSIWTSVKNKGNAPSKRYQAASCSEGKYLFVFGGKGADIYNDIFFFNTDLLEWRVLKSDFMTGPSPRYGSCMVYFRNSLYVYGGLTEAGPTSELWMFDLHYKLFDYVSNSNLQTEHNECFLEGSTLIVVSYNHTHKFIQYFNIDKSEWTDYVSLDLDTYGPVHFYFMQKVLTIGGIDTEYILHEQVTVFDIGTTKKTSFFYNVPACFAAKVYLGEMLYIYSGIQFSGNLGLAKVPSVTMIALNLSQISSGLNCSKGTVYLEGKCSPCAAGFLADDIGLASCKPCPVGTYSSSIGASSFSECKSCKTGTWSNTTGQTQCRECPSNLFCPYGSISPALSLPLSVFQSVQPGLYKADRNLYDYSSSLSIYISLGGIFITLCCIFISKNLRDKLFFIDIYTMNHNHKLMVPMYIKQTALGGLCTLLFLFISVNYVIISVLKFNMINLTESRALVPLITFPGPMIISADIQFIIDFRFYGGSCTSDILHSSSEGITGNLTFSCLKINRICRVTVNCFSCSVDTQSGILISLKEIGSFANEIVINTTCTSSIPNENSTVITSVRSEENKILTGNNYSKVFFELIPSLFSDEYTYTTGYHINGDFSSFLGDQTEEIVFVYSSHVSLYVSLAVTSTYLEISRRLDTGLLELFSALIGTVFGLLSSVGGILKISEKHYDSFLSWLQHRNMLNYYRRRVRKLIRVIYNEGEYFSNKSTSDMMSYTIEKTYTDMEKSYLKNN